MLRPTLIDTLQTLHMVGPLLDLAPPGLVIKRTAEHRRLVSDLCWWLRQQPGVSSRSSAALSFHVCPQQQFIEQRPDTAIRPAGGRSICRCDDRVGARRHGLIAASQVAAFFHRRACSPAAMHTMPGAVASSLTAVASHEAAFMCTYWMWTWSVTVALLTRKCK
jgi:hypothetical protein